MSEPKQNWIEKVTATCDFHREALRQAHNNNTKWTLQSTATALNKSIGKISEQLMLGEALKTHRKQLEKFKNETDALEFWRQRRKELRMM